LVQEYYFPDVQAGTSRECTLETLLRVCVGDEVTEFLLKQNKTFSLK